ncbi:MAG TPA: potassium-transporting ATPase subunit KdpC [Bryobacteraceae bacterium]|nr:potassium-transporting ATPase subunit KdpC [Bryobacteraceae bacterium]
MKQLIIALRVTLVFAILTGVAYPLLVTGLAQAIFPRQADGSLIQSKGKAIGSDLVGQQFSRPEYFQGRPSAAGNGYDGLASGPSNLGPTNQHLIDRVQGDLKKFREANPTATGPLPADLLTASGSGLDPDISPASAEAQIPRVAAARGMSAGALRNLVASHTEGRQFGVLGEPRVNVLKLNLALDEADPVKK